jgi:hypothetical protein
MPVLNVFAEHLGEDRMRLGAVAKLLRRRLGNIHGRGPQLGEILSGFGERRSVWNLQRRLGRGLAAARRARKGTHPFRHVEKHVLLRRQQRGAALVPHAGQRFHVVGRIHAGPSLFC